MIDLVPKLWDPFAKAKLRLRPVIAIDPGSNGGLFYADEHRVGVAKLPAEDGDIVELLRHMRRRTVGEITAAVEEIPKWCGSAQFERKTVHGASIASLYGNFKLCTGAAMALNYVVKRWIPIAWQHNCGARSNGWKSSMPGWKNHLKEVAASRMPELKVTLWSADAILIGLAEIYAKK